MPGYFIKRHVPPRIDGRPENEGKETPIKFFYPLTVRIMTS
jgi:hypothetical protein